MNEAARPRFRLWCIPGAIVTALVVSACGTAPEEAAERSSTTAPAPTAQSDSTGEFCKAFKSAVAVRNQRYLEYNAQLSTQPPTTAPGQLPMDGVMTAFGGFMEASAVIENELLSSLPQPLPSEIRQAVERSIAINAVYLDGRIPSEQEVDEVYQRSVDIVDYVNARCGLRMEPADL